METSARGSGTPALQKSAAKPPLGLQPAPLWPASTTRERSMVARPSVAFTTSSTKAFRSKPCQTVAARPAFLVWLGAASTNGLT